MSITPYVRVLLVGPDLQHGSYAELFQRQLTALRGAEALADIVDTSASYAGLWQQIRTCISAGQLPLLLIDLDPNSSSPYLDWLRSELQGIGNEQAVADRLFVARGNSEALESIDALIGQTDKHLGCVDVPSLPDAHAWSCIPPHSQRVLLCNGPRCTRRGALPLWKSLREQLKAAGKLECEGGVHITRTQCQFPCDQGPTLSLYPAGIWYQVRSEDDVRRLVQEQFVEGRPVAELIMSRD
ncbi:2Fe-2S ferredoxin [Pseudomonas alcaligenes]|uniref:2Fe-2S ferredoxin n=1 Tax=Aquipseudomonas alcaligenes TaxID=43263 RepID=A0ABR7RZW3_AQUAC|nr:(2Fe-2S) ferredoxin domain-containing protein [Pseudomonas alcaligenes]MBC9250870.1 2Fe-2S ferredoxin [Pseudomonas alcaligenes]